MVRRRLEVPQMIFAKPQKGAGVISALMMGLRLYRVNRVVMIVLWIRIIHVGDIMVKEFYLYN